jgi:hypothetical protein
MQKPLIALATLAFVGGLGGEALADPYADSAVSISRVTSGVDEFGTAINTSWDTNNDDGSDSTGAPNVADGPRGLTILGFDANVLADPLDDEGGTVTLDFIDNVCLDGAAMADIDVPDIIGDESARIEVSNDGGKSFVTIGEVFPGAYQIDLAGQVSYFNRIRITSLDHFGTTNTAGFDLDYVECLNSTPAESFAASNDGCDLRKGEGGLDVKEVLAFADDLSNTVFVKVELCGTPGSRTAYEVNFDFAGGAAGGPDTLDGGNAGCADTAEQIASFQGGFSGPGGGFVDGNVLMFDIGYGELSPDLLAGNDMLIWVSTREKGGGDHAPNVEQGDRCDFPQADGEVLAIKLS